MLSLPDMTSRVKTAFRKDSKKGQGSHVDRHEVLGKGELGIETFRRIMRDPRFDRMPLILETPDEENWAEEIKMLYKLEEHKSL